MKVLEKSVFGLRCYKNNEKQPDFELQLYTNESKSGVSIEELIKVVIYIVKQKRHIPKYYIIYNLLIVILNSLQKKNHYE